MWSFHILFGRYRDWYFGTAYSTVNHHPFDTKFFRDGNKTFPIVLPHIEWEGNSHKISRVHLFNLKADPFEHNNLAFTHRDLVEQMTSEIIEQIKDAPPQVGAIHYTFRVFIFIIRVVEIFFLLLFCLTILFCTYIRSRCRKLPKPAIVVPQNTKKNA